MTIEYQECANAGNGLFVLLAKYNNIADLVSAICESADNDEWHEPFNLPLDFSVTLPTEKYKFIVAGKLNRDWRKYCNKLKKIPIEYKRIPNDYLEIIADDFERELYIYPMGLSNQESKEIS